MKRLPNIPEVTPAVWAVADELPEQALREHWDRVISPLLKDEQDAQYVAFVTLITGKILNNPPFVMRSHFRDSWAPHLPTFDEAQEKAAELAASAIGRCYLDLADDKRSWKPCSEFEIDSIPSFRYVVDRWSENYPHKIESCCRRFEEWKSAA